MNRDAIDLKTEERAFRAGIGDWAIGYSSYRALAPAPLGKDAAQADLRRWSGRYFHAQAEAAALASVVPRGDVRS